MGGTRNPQREALVKALNRVAQAKGLAALPENASRAKVNKLAEDLEALELSHAERRQVQASQAAYAASFSPPHAAAGNASSVAPVASQTWKFSAVQLTYNSSQGDFLSQDHEVLQGLFRRYIAFLGELAVKLSAEGFSATMERASPTQVHLHAYLHLGQTFHRRGADALSIFVFEGIHPHLVPNKASGKAYAGAVRLGHFYVVVDKIGSLSLGVCKFVR